MLKEIRVGPRPLAGRSVITLFCSRPRGSASACLRSTGSGAFIERLAAIGAWIASAALVGIVVLVTFETLARSVFGFSTQISDEMCGYLSVAVVFLGMAKSLQDGAHVRVEPLYERFKGTAALAVRWLIVLVSIAYCRATTVLAKYLSYSFARGIVSTSSPRRRSGFRSRSPWPGRRCWFCSSRRFYCAAARGLNRAATGMLEWTGIQLALMLGLDYRCR